MGNLERFEGKYVPVTESGCWLWVGGCIPTGYGMFKMSEHHSNQGAHRCAWMLYRGPLPDGAFVCHKCDTPSCVNPDHLFLGTAMDNRRDCMRKGRSIGPRGEKQHLAKLTVNQVLAIRSDSRTQREIAFEYGIGQQTVSNIKRGQKWAHVGGPIETAPHAVGEAHRRAKLTEAAVRAIREDVRPHTRIAADYGVCASMVRKIKLRRSWAHVA